MNSDLIWAALTNMNLMQDNLEKFGTWKWQWREIRYWGGGQSNSIHVLSTSFLKFCSQLHEQNIAHLCIVCHALGVPTPISKHVWDIFLPSQWSAKNESLPCFILLLRTLVVWLLSQVFKRLLILKSGTRSWNLKVVIKHPRTRKCYVIACWARFQMKARFVNKSNIKTS